MEPKPSTSKKSSPASPGLTITKTRVTRARKRRRISSESSSDTDPVLPDNLLEVEKNLHASAVKNNLDDVSVKKILKTVVTNDHVLALVKLQEEEENMGMHSDTPKPKLTRSKAKELRKVSPKTAWNLENLELTPIKHIPVKTRPEVTALIAQELHEDEDDEEYDPTHDAHMQSDDDQTMESCSDLDSQPRTPATPQPASPRVVKDGPFKVPQDISTPRRKLDMDEEATIALRTRSKLSLSSVPIDHIEGSFIPPDELPMPAADDVWTEFLQICLNPDTETQDDDDDPEYNVAQDPDAHDEDEEGLENIMKISKKELNDLVTELFSVMPENLGEELGGKLTSETGKSKEQNIQQSTTTCKQETLSEEETPQTPAPQIREKEKRLSIGKSEAPSDNKCQESENKNEKKEVPRPQPLSEVIISVVEGGLNTAPGAAGPSVPAPLPLQNLLVSERTMVVQVEQGTKVLPEQIEIYQQQLRQHVQLAASHFLQLFVHPVHWSLAPTYKEYLETFSNMVGDNPQSVANVCNLKPAMELVLSWEQTISEDTPENKEMVEFVSKEIERSRRRAAQNNYYIGDFHKTFLHTVSNSPVFLYPHLLPPLPFRSDGTRKFGYLRCEDELIVLGMDQFWQYVEDNPELFKMTPVNSMHRAGLIHTLQLVSKHMFPWIKPKGLLAHIRHVRKLSKHDLDNPVVKFFEKREVAPVKHMLLPFNPKLTLYEQPENEMPKIWVRYLALSSKRFSLAKFRRPTFLNRYAQAPIGVPVEIGSAATPPPKNPLPIGFTKQMVVNRPTDFPTQPNTKDRFDIELAPLTPGQDIPTLTPITTPAEQTGLPPLTPISATNTPIYNIVQTSTGAYLIPVSMTNVTNSATTPICSSEVNETSAPENASKTNRVSVTISMNAASIKPVIVTLGDHCSCCVKLRNICKIRQSLITEYLKLPKRPSCPCREKKNVKYPRATKKLRLLVNSYKSKYSLAWSALQSQTKMLANRSSFADQKPMVAVQYNLEEIAAVTSFQLKLTIRSNVVARNIWLKRRLYSTISQFNPDTDDIYAFMKHIEKLLDTEGVDVYKEFLGYLTMEQADKIGNYVDYFNQECLTGLMKKVEELVICGKRKYEILNCLEKTLSIQKQTACEVCSRILDTCSGYPALAEYVFSLFPHTNPRLDPKNQNKVAIRGESKTKPTSTPNATPLVINTLSTAPKPVTETEKDPTVTYNIEKNSAAPQRVLRSRSNKNIVSKTSNSAPQTIENNNIVNLISDEDDDRTVQQVTDNAEKTKETTDTTEAQATDNVDTAVRTDNMEVEKDKSIGNVEDRTVQQVTDNAEKTKETTDTTEAQATDNVDTAVRTDNMEVDKDKSIGNVEDRTVQQVTDNAEKTKETTDKTEVQGTDKVDTAVRTDNMEVDNDKSTGNVEQTMCDDSQAMDYEADHSASDDDSRNDSLIINEDPEESRSEMQTITVKIEETTPENVFNTPQLTVAKTEIQDYSESDMSMMIMSEDEHSVIKTEAPEWKRDEDKTLLEVLKQSLTPEEMKDKTILEIIEQKKVLTLATDSLPEKSFDDVRERILYLLEFLVLNEQMLS